MGAWGRPHAPIFLIRNKKSPAPSVLARGYMGQAPVYSTLTILTVNEPLGACTVTSSLAL